MSDFSSAFAIKKNHTIPVFSLCWLCYSSIVHFTPELKLSSNKFATVIFKWCHCQVVESRNKYEFPQKSQIFFYRHVFMWANDNKMQRACMPIYGLSHQTYCDSHIYWLLSFFVLFLQVEMGFYICILGTKYKTGCTLQIDIDQYDSPVFGQILKICIVDGNFSDICFVVSKLTTKEFDSHYQGFEVQTILPRRKLIIHHKDLASFLALNQVKPYGVVTRNKYIVQRFDIGSIN